MKKQKSLLIGMLFCSLVSTLFAGTYGGGSGTAADPYQIATKAHLLELAATTTDYDKSFILTANIDLDPALPGGQTFTTAVIAPGTYDSRYEFSGTAFTGVFNGNNHIISNLTIHNDNGGYLGLFGATAAGQVTNLRLNNVNVGGYNATDVGGLVGENDGCMISNCSCTGQISGRDCVGGFAGSSDSGTITACYTTGTVTGTGDWIYDVGGLVGWNGGGLSNCYSTCDVTSGNNTSGLGGLVSGNSGSIIYCYSAGAVIGGGSYSDIGGLVGRDGSTVAFCFWDTQTSGMTTSAGGWGKTTAQMKQEMTFLGWNNGNWVINEGVDYPHLIWEATAGQVIDYETPRVYPGNGADQPFELDSAEDMVCLSLRPADWNSKVVLTSDIDMSSISDYTPIALFGGQLDGQGHKISHLTIDTNVLGNRNQVGLIKQVIASGWILNLELDTVTIQGEQGLDTAGGLCGQNDGTVEKCSVVVTIIYGEDSEQVGGLCGENLGTIRDCSAVGTMSGADPCEFGGLCGGNSDTGLIENCFSTISITGNAISCGGLVSSNGGTINNCYATGAIGGGTSWQVGGLVGSNYQGKVIRCYSTGKPTGISNVGGLCGAVTMGGNYEDTGNFWDMQTSEIATSRMGTGNTTAQMKTLSTFTSAGWDFGNIWAICEGTNYPRLQWQMPAVDWACPDGVYIEDLDYFVGQWLATNCTAGNDYCGQRDMNNSGIVNIADFAILAQHWLE